MNVYDINQNGEKYERLAVTGSNQWRPIQLQPNGKPFGASWVPLVLCSAEPEDEGYPGPLPTADFTGIGGSRFGLRTRALELDGDFFGRYGELLPLETPKHFGPLKWFHCTTVIDALDESQTIAERFDDGRMHGFDRLWFKPQMLREAQVFVVPQCKGYLLCTDTFKRHIEALGLTGLRFTLKWSDEREGIERINAWEKMAFKGSLPPIPVP